MKYGNAPPAAVHAALNAALAAKPVPPNLAADVARFGSSELEFYAPHRVDPQRPHSRDELYVIARGTGTLAVEDAEYRFAAGDVLFVAAHARHRFTHFSEDFGTWVLFYGPEGGERNAP